MAAFAVLASTLALACPQNLASKVDTPATARQLITVEAKVLRTTYAERRPTTPSSTSPAGRSPRSAA